MKKIQFLAKSALSVLALCTVLSLSSCKDECKDVNCDNGGTCVDGICDCPAGYEGDNCETAMRTKFLRTGATTTEVCSGITTSPYAVDIVTGTAVTEIRVKNLGNYNCTVGDYYVTANVTGTGNITIPSQQVCGTALTFSGSGTYSGGTVSITYTASYEDGGPVTDNCTATIQ